MKNILKYIVVLSLVLCSMMVVCSAAGTDLSENYEIFTVDGEKVPYTLPGFNPDSYTRKYFGVKDKSGNIVIPAKYAGLFFYKDVLIAGEGVYLDVFDVFRGLEGGPKYGIIDIHENVLVPFEFSEIEEQELGLDYLQVTKAGSDLYGVVNTTLNYRMVVEPKYAHIKRMNDTSYVSSEFFAVSDTRQSIYDKAKGKWGVWDDQGNEIIPMQYDSVRYLADGYFRVSKNGLSGVIDRNSQIILPVEYDYSIVDYLGDGCFEIQKNGLSGVIDKNQRIILPTEYKDIRLKYKDSFCVTKFVTEEYYQQSLVRPQDEPDKGELWWMCGVVDIHNNPLIDFAKGQVITLYKDTFEVKCWTGNVVPSRSSIGGMNWYVNEYEVLRNVKYEELNAPAPSDTTHEESQTSTFTDVKQSDYYYNAVLWAVDQAITNGTSATTFSPNNTCTRAQILTFLWRAVGSPESKIDNPFHDVDPGDYFYTPALWAYENGMVSGNAFEGSTPCTRASTVTYLWQFAGTPEMKLTDKFADVPTDSSYAQAVSWALENGVTGGTSAATFSPDRICTRGQIVTFLFRASSGK